MTPEEAGQRLLEGQAWVICPTCAAEVRKLDPDLNGAADYIDRDACTQCKGLRTILDPTYALACRVLGRALPVRVIGFTAQEEIGVAVVNLPGIRRLGFSSQDQGVFEGTTLTGSGTTDDAQ